LKGFTIYQIHFFCSRIYSNCTITNLTPFTEDFLFTAHQRLVHHDGRLHYDCAFTTEQALKEKGVNAYGNAR